MNKIKNKTTKQKNLRKYIIGYLKFITNIIVNSIIFIYNMHSSMLRFFTSFTKFAPVLQDQQKHNMVLSVVLSNDALKVFQPNNLLKKNYRHRPEISPPKNSFFLTSQECKQLDPKKITIIEHKGQYQSYQINAIQYEANNGIQDRLVVNTLKTIKAETISVFDGHGGDKLSDYCANHVVEQLDYYLQKNKNNQEYVNDEDKLICDALKHTYEKIDQDFYQNVYKSFVTLNNKKIKSIGTCALTVIIYNNKLYVANSGDSEAIAVCRGPNNEISFIQLNQRFSVNNPSERQRLKKQFPHDKDIVVSQKNGCCYVKGRLQPTRALGDYHLKYSHLFKGKGDFNGPYITCQPDVKIFPIKDYFQRIVVASDGVWDFLKKDTVAEASLQQNPHTIILQKALQRVAQLHKKTTQQIKQISPEEKRSFHDDISIAVVNLAVMKKNITII